jgi:hypothetical protein
MKFRSPSLGPDSTAEYLHRAAFPSIEYFACHPSTSLTLYISDYDMIRGRLRKHGEYA